jgi:peptidoglycan/xylan/chitin deacetylase (PgdA/CDA1 family)
MIPHRTPFFLPLLYPGLHWRIPTNKNEIFLTFDDGPIEGPTEFVLQELARASVKATFFCIGDNIRKHPHLTVKIIEQGHVVGNHTFNHLSGWKTQTTQYIDNILLFEKQLEKKNIANAKLFRPPYGRITREQIRQLPDFKIIMWDVLTQDYNKDLRSEKCLKNSVEVTRPGSIIVFHDSFKAEKNLKYVLPRFLDHFLEKGFVFKTLA